jgi:hypothetical protein
MQGCAFSTTTRLISLSARPRLRIKEDALACIVLRLGGFSMLLLCWYLSKFRLWSTRINCYFVVFVSSLPAAGSAEGTPLANKALTYDQLEQILGLRSRIIARHREKSKGSCIVTVVEGDREEERWFLP